MPAGCDKLQKPTDGTWREKVDWANGSFHGCASSGGALRSTLVNSGRGLGLAGESQGSTRPSQEGFWTVEVSLVEEALSVSRTGGVEAALTKLEWEASSGMVELRGR